MPHPKGLGRVTTSRRRLSLRSRPSTRTHDSSAGTSHSKQISNKTKSSHDGVQITDLPEELMLCIFSYLGHGDRLCVRCVCRTFFSAISSWKGFCSNVVFLVAVAKSRANFPLKDIVSSSNHAIVKSQTKWENLRLEKFRFEGKENGKLGRFTLPQSLESVVHSVEFSKCILSWEGLKENILKFKALQEMKIIQCKRYREKNLRSTIVTRKNFIVDNSSALTSALSTLKSIHFELRRISDITFYLAAFNSCNLSELEGVTIIDIFDSGEYVTELGGSRLFSEIKTLLTRSALTLRRLKIHVTNPEVRKRFIPEILGELLDGQIRGLNSLDLNHFTLELNNIQRDFEIFKKFLSYQTNLLEVRMPPPETNPTSSCQSLLQSLPPKIQGIAIHSAKYMMPTGIFPRFKNLKNFQCDVDIYEFPPNAILSMKLFQAQGASANICTSLIVKSFPNLVGLSLNANGSETGEILAMDDTNLQLICKELTGLESLILGACSKITDFGVTGIDRGWCEVIYRSRALCLDWNGVEIPSDPLRGVPLSNLKRLRQLTLSESTCITDVGIFYGFRFHELRHLNMRDNNDITDWGMDILGAFNPDLDFLYFGCGKWVTSLGIERLKGNLRRIQKRNCICISVNEEYYSSDDSYALESADEN